MYIYIYIFIYIYIYIHIYIYIYIYIYSIYISSLYIHRTTLRYFTWILLNKISLFIFLKLRKSESQGTPLSSCSRGLQLLGFSSTFNNVSQTFNLSNFNNVSQKIFLRPLINSYFCFNLITLQNFVLRT